MVMSSIRRPKRRMCFPTAKSRATSWCSRRGPGRVEDEGRRSSVVVAGPEDTPVVVDCVRGDEAPTLRTDDGVGVNDGAVVRDKRDLDGVEQGGAPDEVPAAVHAVHVRNRGGKRSAV